MSENRVQFNTIVASQLPVYVREEFPLVESFLKSYYLGQEYQGGHIEPWSDGGETNQENCVIQTAEDNRELGANPVE